MKDLFYSDLCFSVLLGIVFELELLPSRGIFYCILSNDIEIIKNNMHLSIFVSIFGILLLTSIKRKRPPAHSPRVAA